MSVDRKLQALRDLHALLIEQVKGFDSLHAGELAALSFVTDNALGRWWLRDPQYADDDGRRQVQDFVVRPEVAQALLVLREHFYLWETRLRFALAAIDAGEPLPDGGNRAELMRRAALEREKAAA